MTTTDSPRDDADPEANSFLSASVVVFPHLGSSAMSTDAIGNVTVNQGYYAYGRYRSGGTLPTDRRYTGQQLDDTGLYYYNARYYDPLLGTFLSPDTLVPDPGNVQAYNRYLYALGNPIKYNDPSGHCVFGGIDTVICILAGAALILGGDSTNTTYVPTQADINSSKLGGALILAGGGGAVANLIGPTAKATVVGAAANATANATAQIRRDGTINPAEAGIAAGYGAVSGFAAPLPGWGYVISTVAGGAQQVTTDTLINGQSLSEAVNINTGIAAGLSFAGAIAQGSMPSTLEYPTSDGGKFNVETLPVDYAPVYTRETTRQLSVEQAAYAGSIKYISGYFISSLPVSVGQDAQYSEPIRGPR